MNAIDVGADLEITSVRLASSGGTWASGTLNGHRFDALVFCEHAENPDWELNDSRISKLWLRRMADRCTAFNWDRGMDIPAADDVAAQIVGFLCAGLAEHIFGR